MPWICTIFAEGNGINQQRGVPIHAGLFAQPGWGPWGSPGRRAVLEAFCIGFMVSDDKPWDVAVVSEN